MIYGVGISDADYVVTRRVTVSKSGEKQKQKLVWVCPFYRKWTLMLTRCYSKSYLSRNKSYELCYVCDEWLTFSNFKSWMEKQDWRNKELDKDLILKGNKVYCEEYCSFVNRETNAFIVNTNYCDIRCSLQNGKYVAYCRNPITRKSNYLGCFESQELAKSAWLTRKREFARMLSESESDHRVKEALIKYFE